MNADNNMMSGFYEGILIAIKMFIASSMFLVVVFICNLVDHIAVENAELLKGSMGSGL